MGLARELLYFQEQRVLKVTEQCLRCLSSMDGFMEGRVSSSPDNPGRLVSAVIMGWIEWGEEKAGEQVRDLASGPGKGSKGLGKGSGGKGGGRL